MQDLRILGSNQTFKTNQIICRAWKHWFTSITDPPQQEPCDAPGLLCEAPEWSHVNS